MPAQLADPVVSRELSEIMWATDICISGTIKDCELEVWSGGP